VNHRYVELLQYRINPIVFRTRSFAVVPKRSASPRSVNSLRTRQRWLRRRRARPKPGFSLHDPIRDSTHARADDRDPVAIASRMAIGKAFGVRGQNKDFRLREQLRFLCSLPTLAASPDLPRARAQAGLDLPRVTRSAK